MLSAEHVLARRRQGKLVLTRPTGPALQRLEQDAELLLRCYLEHRGQPRDKLRQALRELGAGASSLRAWSGLVKLCEDAAHYQTEPLLEPVDLRRAVFSRASAARRAGSYERAAILEATAQAHGVSLEQVEAALFADLHGAEVLRSAPSFSATELVGAWQAGQVQAVLLRAVRVTVLVECASPEAYRALFAKLKFRRLLYRIQPAEPGYLLEIDGPFGLFESVTKYGLALALLLPALEGCQRYRLSAELRWGKARETLEFQHEGGGAEVEGALEVEERRRLLEEFGALGSAWTATRSEALLQVPGLGVIVPDLCFLHRPTGARLHLELLGYWSREAVWRRVDYATAGLPEPVLFALSRRLRVSEQVLEDEQHAALYVYKGVPSARAVLEKLEALRSRAGLGRG